MRDHVDVDGFNPRPREGATTADPARRCERRQVSIHAPAKGRLDRARLGPTARISFNPRPREGATLHRMTSCRARQRFQSTPPRRGDLAVEAMRLRIRSFQSTPPRRGDRVDVDARDVWHGFNPRPREGATSPADGSDAAGAVSIHAPAKGATSTGQARTVTPVQCFNPRPREGATVSCASASIGDRFQSTPPRRGDAYGASWLSTAFQSTPPRRGDSAILTYYRIWRMRGIFREPWDSDKSLLGSKSGLRPRRLQEEDYGDREPPSLPVCA